MFVQEDRKQQGEGFDNRLTVKEKASANKQQTTGDIVAVDGPFGKATVGPSMAIMPNPAPSGLFTMIQPSVATMGGGLRMALDET